MSMARVKASPCVYFVLQQPPFSLPSAVKVSISAGKKSPKSVLVSAFRKQRDMEGSRRCDSSSLPVLSDLTVNHRCENQSRLSESAMISNSFLTVENSEVRLHPIENLAETAWTNEKHNRYLDHLESSFVKQLHRSVINTHHRYSSKQRFTPGSNTTMNMSPRGHNIRYFEEFTDQNFPNEASEQMFVNKMPK